MKLSLHIDIRHIVIPRRQVSSHMNCQIRWFKDQLSRSYGFSISHHSSYCTKKKDCFIRHECGTHFQSLCLHLAANYAFLFGVTFSEYACVIHCITSSFTRLKIYHPQLYHRAKVSHIDCKEFVTMDFHESPRAQPEWQSISSTNRKVVCSTPFGSTWNSFSKYACVIH